MSRQIEAAIIYLFCYHWIEEIEHKSLLYDIYTTLYDEKPQANPAHIAMWQGIQSDLIKEMCQYTAYLSALDYALYKIPYIKLDEVRSKLCARQVAYLLTTISAKPLQTLIFTPGTMIIIVLSDNGMSNGSLC